MISFNEYCRRLDEKNSTANKLEVAYEKKQREKKIKNHSFPHYDDMDLNSVRIQRKT